MTEFFAGHILQGVSKNIENSNNKNEQTIQNVLERAKYRSGTSSDLGISGIARSRHPITTSISILIWILVLWSVE